MSNELSSPPHSPVEWRLVEPKQYARIMPKVTAASGQAARIQFSNILQAGHNVSLSVQEIVVTCKPISDEIKGPFETEPESE